MPHRLISCLAISALLAACAEEAPPPAATETEPTSMTDASSPAPLPTPAAPAAEKRPLEITQHGRTRVDNYAWLKDKDWQEVLRDPSVLDADIRAYLETELDYYKASTANLEELRETLFAEMRGRIKEDDASVPAPDGAYSYYRRFREGGQYPIYARKPSSGGEETILYDGDAEEGDSPFFSIASVNHSPDHTLIAYGVDRLGSEYYTIGIRNVETGEDFPDTIESTDGDTVWAADSKSFFYVERDDNQRPKRVKRHILGTDPADDALIYEEADDGFFLGVSKSQDGEYIFIWSGNQVTSEARFIYAGDPGAAPVIIAPREEGVLYYPEHHADYFFLRTNADGAVDFKIVRAPVDEPGRNTWRDIVPHEAGTYISGFVPYQNHFVRAERKDATPRIVVSTWAGVEHEIAFEEAAYSLGLAPGYEYDTAVTRFHYESPAQPEQVFDYDMDERTRTLLKTQDVPSGHNADLYVVETLEAEAADGALVPVTVLRLKTTPVDGTAPVLLYGYGSYGIYIPDSFSTNTLSLVDRGAIYALAHIRGGSARGRQWYLDGKLDKKMNTFTDFVTAAEALVEADYTAPKQIVIYGGSAGGLLVGAAVNLRPDLFGGVLAAVPFVDVLSTISDESLPLTPPEWPEWGDPIRSEEAYGWIAEYSPYDNIKPGEAYPPLLATGGLTDYRVTYWEPAKWVARLREEAAGGPFLLRMNMDAGHGGSAARFERLEETAHLYAFALDIMGKADAEPVEHD